MRRLVFLVLLVCSGQSLWASDNQLAKRICERESRLGWLQVACYELGYASGYDCNRRSLRLTPYKRLLRAQMLSNLPPGCLASIKEEAIRRNYMGQSIEKSKPLTRSLSDQFTRPVPKLWQDN